FATLDPTLRRLELSNGIATVLADTVGFISDLPHELVDAFRSTLVETRDADLLLHVVDVSDDEQAQRIRDVNEVLEGIGAQDTPQLVVYNKIDANHQPAKVQCDDSGRAEAVWVSAITGEGIELLLDTIATILAGRRVTGWLTVSAEQGRLRSLLYSASAVLTEEVQEDGGASLHIDMDAVEFARLSSEYELTANFESDAPKSGVSGQL
ncbi:MAG: 50S ribosome-binding GTPase, partial [Gammaproteobacteria bacterium]|nr:50S ribosome-binding GTPase [Gammaproteobacteria bacterium]